MTRKIIPVISKNSNALLKIPELGFRSSTKNKITEMIIEITAMIVSCFSIFILLLPGNFWPRARIFVVQPVGIRVIIFYKSIRALLRQFAIARVVAKYYYRNYRE